MWAELLSSVLGGGVTGLLGAVVTKWSDYKTKKLEIEASRERFAHEVAMRKVDAELMAQEFAARVKVAETEAAGREAVADAEAFKTALTNEPKRYSDADKVTVGQNWAFVVLDLIRGSVRPLLTVYLCAITTMVYMQARALIGPGGAAIPADEAVGLLRLIVNTVLYLTSSAVLFWFGTRQSRKAA